MPSPLDFHTHHGAFGAYGSFTLGHLRAGGGLNIHDGRAPHQGGIHVGYGRASEGMTLLPFSIPSPVDLSAFTSEEGKPSQQASFQVVPDDLISRKLEWGTDTWEAPGFSLRIATPFGVVPDPRAKGWEALREHILPAVWVELELDNRASEEEAIVFFGMAPGDTGAAELNHSTLVGATCQGKFGLVTERHHMARPYAGFSGPSCFDSQLGLRTPHWLGGTWGVSWTIPARQRETLRVAVGWYHAGQATSGLSTTYAYTRLWPDLESVLAAAVAQQDHAWKTARERDQELSSLSPARKFLLAHATRGYFGNSQLLADTANEPVYVVNEGEYCMINTLDLSVDQGFFEARFFPWATREILDLAARRHSFLDHLKTPDDTNIHDGGVSFSHDMGVRNQFSAPGTSSYEHPNLEGCFSHMTFEQACNFALCAAQYAVASGDQPWTRRNAELLERLLDSLQRREHPLDTHRRGTPTTDSVRCGTGTEITTYDSMDPALAQTRENLYSTVKLWAAYLALEKLLGTIDSKGEAIARTAALRSARAVVDWPEVDGLLPAIADGRNGSAILPAVEGLVYPLWWNDLDSLSRTGPFAEMIRRLERHMDASLQGGLCRFTDGGWRLSSTSDNSWLSKIFLAQTVSERVFGNSRDPRADTAHVRWLAPGSASTGFTDQIIEGKGIGSRYYPRGVTAILFLMD
ncbi:MAG: hypothetical protein IPN71_22970 [Fibrobacteres bacterium]|nr:hypothetical protein [Fibrobacterota bacterium]